MDLGDAWDFPMDYAEASAPLSTVGATTARVEGTQALVEQHYALGHSTLHQTIVLTAGSPRLDFQSQLHWRERQTMLRTSFPVAVHAEAATYEIQFGHVAAPPIATRPGIWRVMRWSATSGSTSPNVTTALRCSMIRNMATRSKAT